MLFLIWQMNIGINPAALLPGAAPPVKEPDNAAVGFDTPAEAKTLHSANKVLPKCLVLELFCSSVFQLQILIIQSCFIRLNACITWKVSLVKVAFKSMHGIWCR